MSGKVRVWPDGRIVIETDEPVSAETVEMITQCIRERSLLVLGKGWRFEHESDWPPTFGQQWKVDQPDSTWDRVLDLATALFFVAIAVFMILLGLLGIASIISIAMAA